MKKLLILSVLIIAGCNSSTEQPCKYMIDETKQDYVEICP